MAALLLPALTAGILFAAHEPGQTATEILQGPPEERAPERVFAQPGDIDEQINLPPITKEPPRYPNLDSNLNRLAKESLNIRKAASPDRSPSGQAAEPVLVTFYVAPAHVAGVRRYLENKDIVVRNAGEDYIEAHVPPPLLGAASEQPGVLRVDTILPPRPAQSWSEDFTSEGVELHGAGAWHDAGYRGQGIKVGVIDIGFSRFSYWQTMGELPRNVTVQCYFKDGRAPSSRLSDCESHSDHGTSVAEMLLDVAPEVELYIANPYSLGDFRNAVDWMAGAGVKVINYSVGQTPDGPGDGTSPFSNSPLKTIDAAVRQGIMWSNAGGNDAQKVWYGAFSDPDGNGWHNFTPRDEGNGFYLDRASRGVLALIRWDDSWGGADCDLDLVLSRNAQGRHVLIDKDDRPQSGGDADVPFALINFEATIEHNEGYYSLAIRRNHCPDPPAWIQLINWSGANLQHHSPGHHMASPAESRNPGMMAVGATHWRDSNAIADYSSRGPTIDGRTKPDITGAACTQSPMYLSRPEQCESGGTSHASPHVAGLAALVRQRFPDFGPVETANYLKQNARERGPAGADNTWGHGLAFLPATSVTPTATPTPTRPPTATPAPVPGPVTSPGPPTVATTGNAGELAISWNSVPSAKFYTIGWTSTGELADMQAASRDWLDAFHFTTVPARYTKHTISGLKNGENYYGIVGARTTRFGGESPAWSDWSSPVATAGQPEDGLCPVTGLPLPPGGYLSVNQSTESASGTFTLTGVSRKANISLSGTGYPPRDGRAYVKVCGQFQAGNEERGWFYRSYDYQIDTDTGLAFAKLDQDVTPWNNDGPVPAGQSRTGCETWDVPSDAATAIVAINNQEAATALYQVPLP